MDSTDNSSVKGKVQEAVDEFEDVDDESEYDVEIPEHSHRPIISQPQFPHLPVIEEDELPELPKECRGMDMESRRLIRIGMALERQAFPDDDKDEETDGVMDEIVDKTGEGHILFWDDE